jgi:hypothetical protein
MPEDTLLPFDFPAVWRKKVIAARARGDDLQPAGAYDALGQCPNRPMWTV